MVAVNFSFGGYLHDADDLADFITFERRSPSMTRSPQGTVYITAAGTRRWTFSPGVNETFHVSTRTRDSAVHDWIYRRDGDIVLYRDMRSRLEYGVITNVTVNDLHNGVFELDFDVAPIDQTHHVVEGDH